MFEMLEQLFWWLVLIVSAPSLVVAVIALFVMCDIEKYKEAKNQ